MRSLHAGWRVSVAALAGLCALGAVTVEIPPANAIVLGAVLGLALVITARRSPTARRAGADHAESAGPLSA